MNPQRCATSILVCLSLTVSIKAQDILSVTDSLINSIRPATWYFIGQAHNNSINVPLEQELLFALNRKYGLRYDILEYSHSTAIIINEYLRTGADSLLTSIHPDAAFTFIRTVKKFNDTSSKKISFYGIDFEGRNNDAHLKKAIEIILYKTGLPDTSFLYKILVKPDLQQLKNYLEHNGRHELGDCYIDLLLIANAQYGFSPKRDDAMFENFKRLYNELIKTDPAPLFLSSFGYAHINPGNSQSIVSRVRDKAAVIGIQYFQSSFHQIERKKWTGNLSFLCRNKSLQTLEVLDGKPSIHFLSRQRLSLLSCDPKIQQLDALILVSHMTGTKHYSWE